MSKKEKQLITSHLITLSKKHQLNTVIVDSRGRPDTLAINLYWDEFRSWHNPKKVKNRNATESSKLKKNGISTSYKKLMTKYYISESTLRRKLVQLEQLELISRNFEKEKKFNKVFQNQLIVYVWKQTPHFYNPFGIDREQIKSIRQATNYDYIASKYNKKTVSSNDTSTTPQSQSNKGFEGQGHPSTDEGRGYLHEVKSNYPNQSQLNKGVKEYKSPSKNKNQKVEVKKASQSKLDNDVEAQGHPSINEGTPPSVDEGTYILREELESYTSFQRSSFKEKTNKKESSQIHYRFNYRFENTHNATFAPCLPSEQEQVAQPTKPQPDQTNKSIAPNNELTANEEKAIEHARKTRSNENTGIVAISDLMTKILDESEKPQEHEELTEMKQENNQITNCSNAILTEHSQFAPPVDDRNITTKQQPIENINDTSIATKEASLVTEMLPMDQQENAQPDKPQENSYSERVVNEFLEKSSLTFAPGTFGINDHEQEGDKQTRKMLLSKALCSAFGEQVAGDIQDNCKFEEISPHKVTIKLRENITFNDIDKTKIRKAIQSVYGDDVTIALGSKEANVDNHAVESEHGLAREDVLANKASLNTQHSCWLEFKGVIQDRRVHELLCNPTLKIIELADKIIVEAYSFLVDEITSSACLEALESAIVQTGITLEVHDKHVPRSYAVPERKPTVLTKEKILKDRAWRKSFVEKMDELAEDDPKRDSFVIAFKNSKQASRWWQ